MRPRLPHLALLALITPLLAAPEAVAGVFTPESGPSRGVNDIDTLYRVTLYIGLGIFLLVQGVLIYSLVKFRAKRGAPAPAQIRGNAPLEISWTVAASLVLAVLAAVTFIMLPRIVNPPASLPGALEIAKGTSFATINQKDPPEGRALEIGVNGQNFIWRYDYPSDEGPLFSYHTLVVPVNTTVTLSVTAQDVIHSWWVPKLAPKVDGTPGYVNETWFRAEETGEFDGVCAELCGEGHAEMRTRVVVLPLDEYEAWVEHQRTSIQDAFDGLAEQREQREQEEDEEEGDGPPPSDEDGAPVPSRSDEAGPQSQ